MTTSDADLAESGFDSQWGLNHIRRNFLKPIVLSGQNLNTEDNPMSVEQWELVGLRRRVVSGSDLDGQWVMIALRRKSSVQDIDAQWGLNFITQLIASETDSNIEGESEFYWRWELVGLRPKTAVQDESTFGEEWGLSFLKRKVESEKLVNTESTAISNGQWELVDYQQKTANNDNVNTRGDPGVGGEWSLTGLRRKNDEHSIHPNTDEEFGFGREWQLIGFRRKPSSNKNPTLERESGFDGLWGLIIFRLNSAFIPQGGTGLDGQWFLRHQVGQDGEVNTASNSGFGGQWELRTLKPQGSVYSNLNINDDVKVNDIWEMVGLRRIYVLPDTIKTEKGQWVVIALRRKSTAGGNHDGQGGLNFLTQKIASETQAHTEGESAFYWQWELVDLKPRNLDENIVYDNQWGLNFLKRKITSENKMMNDQSSVSNGQWELVDYRRTTDTNNDDSNIRGDPGIWGLTGLRRRTDPNIKPETKGEFGFDGEWQLIGFRQIPLSEKNTDIESESGLNDLWGIKITSHDISPKPYGQLGVDGLWGLNVLRRKETQGRKSGSQDESSFRKWGLNVLNLKTTLNAKRKDVLDEQSKYTISTTPTVESGFDGQWGLGALKLKGTGEPLDNSGLDSLWDLNILKRESSSEIPGTQATDSTVAPTPATTTTSTIPTTTTKSISTTTTTTTTTESTTTMKPTEIPNQTTTTLQPTMKAYPPTSTKSEGTLSVSQPQSDQDLDTSNNLNFVKACKGKPADIYFLLDSSSSVWVNHFNFRVLKFVRDTVSSFKISPMDTRVGVVTFSSEVDHSFGLSDYTNAESLKKAINPDNVEYLTGGTNTGDAINYVANKIFGTGEGRRDVAQIIITVTDGLSQKPWITAKAAADARKKGIYMFAVGIGKYTDEEELMNISSNPDEDFVFSVDDFDSLSSITGLLASKTCKAVASKASDNDILSLNDQHLCSTEPTNIVFGYTYLNSAKDSKIIVQNVITDFAYDLQRSAPHIKVAMVSQPCIGGTTSLMAVGRFQKALTEIKSNYRYGYPGIIKKMRLDTFKSVPLTDNRIAVLFFDENTRNLDLLQGEVRRLRFKNVKVIAVAIGNVNKPVLNTIVSLPHTKNIIHVDSYDALKRYKLSLLNAVCR